MSTEITTQLEGKTITRFWGGESRGAMIQVTGDYGYVQFNLKEAAEFVKIFADFTFREAKRRQKLLSKKVQTLKELEKTVFNEVADLDNSLLRFDTKLIAVELINRYAPIVENYKKEIK